PNWLASWACQSRPLATWAGTIRPFPTAGSGSSGQCARTCSRPLRPRRRTGMLPDHLNPRVRLRDWLNKPSRAEREAAQERAESGNFSTISARHTVVIDPDDGKIIGTAT